MTKGYLIFEVEVFDPEGYDRYRSVGLPVMEQYGGRVIAGGGRSQLLEGDTAKRGDFFVVEFASYEQARSFYYSDAYQQALPLRIAAAKARGILLEGVS